LDPEPEDFQKDLLLGLCDAVWRLSTGGTRGWPAGAMATPNTVKKFKYLINISILKHKNYHFTYFL
jgi:hypothetical protein